MTMTIGRTASTIVNVIVKYIILAPEVKCMSTANNPARASEPCSASFLCFFHSRKGCDRFWCSNGMVEIKHFYFLYLQHGIIIVQFSKEFQPYKKYVINKCLDRDVRLCYTRGVIWLTFCAYTCSPPIRPIYINYRHNFGCRSMQ